MLKVKEVEYPATLKGLIEALKDSKPGDRIRVPKIKLDGVSLVLPGTVVLVGGVQQKKITRREIGVSVAGDYQGAGEIYVQGPKEEDEE